MDYDGVPVRDSNESVFAFVESMRNSLGREIGLHHAKNIIKLFAEKFDVRKVENIGGKREKSGKYTVLVQSDVVFVQYCSFDIFKRLQGERSTSQLFYAETIFDNNFIRKTNLGQDVKIRTFIRSISLSNFKKSKILRLRQFCKNFQNMNFYQACSLPKKLK